MLYDFDTITHEKFQIKTYNPLNPRELIPIDLDLPVFGKKYSKDSNLSLVMTQLSRYSKKRNMTTSPEFLAVKDHLAKVFSTRFFKNSKPIPVDNNDLTRHLKPVFDKMIKNGGVFQELDLFLGPLNKNFSIHFFLKEIVKTVLSKASDANKCGQGISAWSKALNSVFCPMFRAIEEKFKQSLKEECFIDGMFTEGQYDNFIKENFSHDLKFFVNDFKQYDESQDANTQFLEDIVLEMFIEPVFTRIYREMRLSAKQKSMVITLINECLKNSGESATLFTNNIVNNFYLALTTDVVDVRIEGEKGDDSAIVARDIRITNKMMTINRAACGKVKMFSDMDYPLHVDFAGFWWSEFGIIPDLFKILNKTYAKDHTRSAKQPFSFYEREVLYSSYDIKNLTYHEQLQIALRDPLKFLSYHKIVYLKTIYKDMYNITDVEFNLMMQTYSYAMTTKDEQFNRVGFSAIYESDAVYERNDITAADKNRKRVVNQYSNVENLTI